MQSAIRRNLKLDFKEDIAEAVNTQPLSRRNGQPMQCPDSYLCLHTTDDRSNGWSGRCVLEDFRLVAFQTGNALLKLLTVDRVERALITRCGGRMKNLNRTIQRIQSTINKKFVQQIAAAIDEVAGFAVIKTAENKIHPGEQRKAEFKSRIFFERFHFA